MVTLPKQRSAAKILAKCLVAAALIASIAFYFRRDREIAGILVYGWDDHAYETSDDVIFPKDLLQNPYQDGRAGIIYGTSDAEALETKFAYAGMQAGSMAGGLVFKRMINSHIATYGLGSDEIAVVLPDDEPADTNSSWRVFVEDPIDVKNGFGMTIKLATIRFVDYYTVPSKPLPSFADQKAAFQQQFPTLQAPQANERWFPLAMEAGLVAGLERRLLVTPNGPCAVVVGSQSTGYTIIALKVNSYYSSSRLRSIIGSYTQLDSASLPAQIYCSSWQALQPSTTGEQANDWWFQPDPGVASDTPEAGSASTGDGISPQTQAPAPIIEVLPTQPTSSATPQP